MNAATTVVTPCERDGVRWIEFRGLGEPDRLVAAISTRHGVVGDGGIPGLNLSLSVGDDAGRVQENRTRLFHALHVDPTKVSYVNQVHGCRVFEAVPSLLDQSGRNDVVEADAQMTDQPDVALFLTFADCVPILVHDQVRLVVGVGHAGWRGTIAEVGRRLVDAMRDRFGCRMADLRVGIGPAIGPCCYEVGRDVAATFSRRWPDSDVVAEVHAGRPHVDLWTANVLSLHDAGILARNIQTSRICTSCAVGDYFSHRREHGNAGRFAAIVMLR